MREGFHLFVCLLSFGAIPWGAHFGLELGIERKESDMCTAPFNICIATSVSENKKEGRREGEREGGKEREGERNHLS